MAKRIAIDISILKDEHYTGTAIYEYNLLKHLLDINSRDQFILFGIDYIGSSGRLSRLEFKNYKNVQLKILKVPEKLLRTIFINWPKLGFPQLETFTGPVDLFHSFNWYLPPQKNGRRVATFYDLTPVLFPEWHTKRNKEINEFYFRRIAGEADMLVTISENSRQDFRKKYGNTNIEIVFPASSITGIQPDNYQTVSKKYGLKKDYILSVGTIEPRKNIKNLIDAYLASGVTNQLVIAGMPGWENKEVFARLSGPNIVTTGYTSDRELKTLYQNASLFIYPSLYEGFGIPVLEAMSSGIPVITSGISSLPEVGGKSALYVKPGDVSGLTDAIGKVLSDKGLRNKMISSGRIQSQKFSWEKSAEKLNQIYKNLLYQQ